MRISLDSNAAAMSSSVVLPKQLPVMPLPDAVLFPHALLPLYIFEPRYRNMLEHAPSGTHRKISSILLPLD